MKLGIPNITILTLSMASILCADDLFIEPENLVKYSYDIVEGKVQSVQQAWDTEHRMIYTYTTITIHKTWKNRVALKGIVIKENRRIP